MLDDCTYDAPVLVVVLKEPADLVRARDLGWYRVPLAHLPPRVAADYLAFYQTAAFPPEERWAIRYLAPVRGYRLATRRELIPEEPDHPRAALSYYRISIGPLETLPHPVPSARLRRIAFIPTTLRRLREAGEINDLWIRSTAQERLWQALRRAGAGAERQYPLTDDWAEDEDLPAGPVADFAVLALKGGVALFVTDEPCEGGALCEAAPANYGWPCAGWRLLQATRSELESDTAYWVRELLAAHHDDI